MYKEIVSPILDLLGEKGIVTSETAHNGVKKLFHLAEAHPLTLAVFEKIFADQGRRFYDPRLQVTVGGITFDNPLIVGAGWDKEGKCIKSLHRLGFASIEVGTVVKEPQSGNKPPRQFAYRGVALNSLGFNSPGMEKVAKNLRCYYYEPEIPVGVSLGKNKLTPDRDAPREYAQVAEHLYQLGDYFTINVSSPNTPGLRGLQDKGPLTDIVQAVLDRMKFHGGRKPLFVKIAPDLTFPAIDDVIDVICSNRLAGIVATNTTNNPEIKNKYPMWANKLGGISGDDEEFRLRSDKIIAYIYRATQGKMDIIGVGGVKDTATAMRKIEAGAKAVQVVTGLRGEGTTLPGRILAGMVRRIEDLGAKSILDFRGK